MVLAVFVRSCSIAFNSDSIPAEPEVPYKTRRPLLGETCTGRPEPRGDNNARNPALCSNNPRFVLACAASRSSRFENQAQDQVKVRPRSYTHVGCLTFLPISRALQIGPERSRAHPRRGEANPLRRGPIWNHSRRGKGDLIPPAPQLPTKNTEDLILDRSHIAVSIPLKNT